MLPCPYCVLQRYAFILIAIGALIGLAEKPRKFGLGLGVLAGLSGMGIAGKHVWILENPAISCGIDPVETALNKIFLAELFPNLLKADGLCDTPYPPLLGLSLPAWALIWFSAFTLCMLVLLIKKPKVRGLFGNH